MKKVATREKIKIPKRVQDVIPIKAVWKDGTFQIENGEYSKTFRFEDTNYSQQPKDIKESFLLKYGDFLNMIDNQASAKITVNLKRVDPVKFKETVFFPYDGSPTDTEIDLNDFRREYNENVIAEKGLKETGLQRELYITISIRKKTYEEARSYFNRIATDFSTRLVRLGSGLTVLDGAERLRIFHDFYRAGEESNYRFDLETTEKRGHSFKDYICPDGMEIHEDYLQIGDRYARCLFLREYASYMKDDLIAELTSKNHEIMISMDVKPVGMEEAARDVTNRLLGVEKNITNWQQKQNQNNNFSATPPYHLSKQQAELKEMLDDLTSRDQKMMMCSLTLVHLADTKQKLDLDTDNLLGVSSERTCQMGKLKYRQLDGMNTVLPFGVKRISNTRTLITESLSAFEPFRTQQILEPGGIYLGQNAISNELIIYNRKTLKNYSAFLFGVPGSGKSMAAKQMIEWELLGTSDDIMICDPEGEYGRLLKPQGAQIVHVAPGSGHYINAMDMVEGYADNQDPVGQKSQFIMTLMEQIENRELDGHGKSLIDRAVREVYDEYEHGGPVPTLFRLKEKLAQQPESGGKELALSLELFTSGSLNSFAYETNVDVHNRVVVYDISGLGEHLKKIGLLVISDQMLNRVTVNDRKNKITHIYIDEFHIMFENEFSAAFLDSAWRRFRKRNGFPTAITQNIVYVLHSVAGSAMLSNSDMIVMLSQKARDQELLAEMLSIPDEQLDYITDNDPGCGLIKYGKSLVPFINHFPKDTKLYELMSTDPNDRKPENLDTAS